jgi:hypothetical protein
MVSSDGSSQTALRPNRFRVPMWPRATRRRYQPVGSNEHRGAFAVVRRWPVADRPADPRLGRFQNPRTPARCRQTSFRSTAATAGARPTSPPEPCWWSAVETPGIRSPKSPLRPMRFTSLLVRADVAASQAVSPGAYCARRPAEGCRTSRLPRKSSSKKRQPPRHPPAGLTDPNLITKTASMPKCAKRPPRPPRRGGHQPLFTRAWGPSQRVASSEASSPSSPSLDAKLIVSRAASRNRSHEERPPNKA